MEDIRKRTYVASKQNQKNNRATYHMVREQRKIKDGISMCFKLKF